MNPYSWFTFLKLISYIAQKLSTKTVTWIFKMTV